MGLTSKNNQDTTGRPLPLCWPGCRNPEHSHWEMTGDGLDRSGENEETAHPEKPPPPPRGPVTSTESHPLALSVRPSVSLHAPLILVLTLEGVTGHCACLFQRTDITWAQ